MFTVKSWYSLFFLVCLLGSSGYSQGVLVPTFDDLPEVQSYDDTELRGRIETIEKALQKLSDSLNPPTEPEQPTEPPVEPEDPEDPIDPPTEPEKPEDPEEPAEPPTPGEYPSYEAALRHPALLNAFDFRSQDGINRRSVNAKKGEDPINNENVIYDPQYDAAKLVLKHSNALTNRVEVGFGGAITTGHLVWVWDYRPNEDWRDNNKGVHTHKMFMGISLNAADRRSLEQRFHYFRDPTGWEVDMRPYVSGSPLSGPGAGLDRLTPWTKGVVRVGEWARFYSEVDFTGEVPLYSLRLKQGDEVIWIYERAPIPGLVTHKGGLTGFDPTWANTSQDKSTAGPFVHGHLRNVYVLHSEEPIDLQPILEAEIE